MLQNGMQRELEIKESSCSKKTISKILKVTRELIMYNL